MSLDVYLCGKPIGELSAIGEDAYCFAYAPQTVGEVGAGNVLLSNSLPVRAEPYGPDATRAYVEGLLPQGLRRRQIARELDVDAADGYGLIAELGRDCLGGVVFVRKGEELDGGERRPAWLSEAELEEVVQCPPGQAFDSHRPERMRFALPGERHKLALVREGEDGRWAWPEPGLPSTHIVKPEPPGRPGLVANEHACSIAYRELGLPVAHTSIEEIGGRTCLVSKRFDRWGDGPEADRLHQESIAQALGIAPDWAERRLAAGTPSLGEASGLLRAISEPNAVETLMRTTFCDLLVGCTALRGGNAGLLFGGDGPMLAPFYGIVSTEIYGETRPRPIVIGTDVPPAPLLIDLRHTIELCDEDLQPGIIEAVTTMGAICVALNGVAARAKEEGWWAVSIEEALQLAMSRVLNFREESAYLRPRGGEPPG